MMLLTAGIRITAASEDLVSKQEKFLFQNTITRLRIPSGICVNLFKPELLLAMHEKNIFNAFMMIMKIIY